MKPEQTLTPDAAQAKSGKESLSTALETLCTDLHRLRSLAKSIDAIFDCGDFADLFASHSSDDRDRNYALFCAAELCLAELIESAGKSADECEQVIQRAHGGVYA